MFQWPYESFGDLMSDENANEAVAIIVLILIVVLSFSFATYMIYDEIETKKDNINTRGELIEDDINAITDDLIFLIEVFAGIAFGIFILAMIAFNKLFGNTQRHVNIMAVQNNVSQGQIQSNRDIIKPSLASAVIAFILLSVWAISSFSSWFGGILLFYSFIVGLIGFIIGANVVKPRQQK